MINLTSNSTSPAATGAAAGAAASASAGNAAPADVSQAQDRFLKLLVAQLNNQDPMNPMDNAQMTSQMAQINTVTGIGQLNETMKAMATQFGSLQLMQSAALVGRDVLTAGNELARDGNTVRGSFDLPGTASGVKAEILSPGGQVLGSVDLGSLPAGRKDFEWDAQAYPAASGTLKFRIVAQNGAQAVAATPLMRDRVASVGMDNGVPSLVLSRGAHVNASAVAAVL